jgi:hypothetical protein
VTAVRGRQKGVALFVGMIMLVLITLLAVTSFNLGAGSMQSVGNIQVRNQAMASAQHVIDEIISTPKFIDNPQVPVPLGGGTFGTQKSYDINGDSIADITVTVDAPLNCVQGYPIESGLTSPSRKTSRARSASARPTRTLASKVPRPVIRIAPRRCGKCMRLPGMR